MTPLAAYALSLMLWKFPPGAKVDSLQALPACGTDPAAPTCAIKPVCDAPSVLCKAPWWEPRWNVYPRVEGAWVRVESREAGARRLEVVAQALADAVEATPKDEWDRRELVRVMVSADGWSTGFREDIQVGRTLGPGGETCLIDVQLPTLRKWVRPELAALPNEELRARVAGRDYASLRTCFDAGVVGITHVIQDAAWRCASEPGPLLQKAFALYHTGNACRSPLPRGWHFRRRPDVARYRTLQSFESREATLFPAWYEPSEPLRVSASP